MSETLIKRSANMLLSSAKENHKRYATENICHLLQTIAPKLLPNLDIPTKNSYITTLTEFIEPTKVSQGMRLVFILQTTIEALNNPPPPPKISNTTKPLTTSKKVLVIKKSDRSK